MKKLLITGSILVVTFLFATSSVPLVGQSRDKGPWWPHPIWGLDDQAGASNWITAEKILEAVSLVKTGKVYELGHVYKRDMYLMNERSYSMFLVPLNHPEINELVFNDDYLCAEIGQVGTQLDGFGHVGKRLRMEDGSVANVFYNGVTFDEMESPYGLLKLGIENLKPFITRGILIDVAGYKELDVLPNDYEVTLSDVIGTLTKQGLTENEIKPGDGLFFNFGWSKFWTTPDYIDDNIRQRPGIGQEVADWIIERKTAIVGSDAALDHPPKNVAHSELTLKNGIPNLEFMVFDDLLADNVYEFMFVLTPLRLEGATGSPGRPLAIR